MRKQLGRLWRRARSLLYTSQQRRHGLVGRGDLWEVKRRFQIDFLLSAGLEPRHTLLDLGCGTLRGGIPIIAYLDRSHYWGVDVRGRVLDEARDELADAGLSERRPTLIHTPDIATLRLDQRFDFIWAFSVLIHMTDDVLDDALAAVARHLAADGHFFATVNIGDAPDGTWFEFPVVHRTMDFYRGRAAAHGLEVEALGRLSELGHHTGRAHHDSAVMLRARQARQRA